MRAMKSHPSARTFGCLAGEQCGQWLAPVGLINLVYDLARYEQIVRLKLRATDCRLNSEH